jgi:hypothetical protein
MIRSITYSLMAMLGSLVVFFAAVLWGVYFGFPEPDAVAEKSAQLRFHASLSGWLALIAIASFAVACIALLVSWLRAASSMHLPGPTPSRRGATQHHR